MSYNSFEGVHMKKIALFLVLIVLLIGCDLNRDPYTSKSFKDFMESEGWTVHSISDESNEDFESLLVAEKDGVEIQFAVMNSKKIAKSLFKENKQTFEDYDSRISSNSDISIGNYNDYTRTVDDYYFVVSRIDDTLLFAAVDKEDKSIIKDITKKLGY